MLRPRSTTARDLRRAPPLRRLRQQKGRSWSPAAAACSGADEHTPAGAVFAHRRDPYTRIDVLRSSRRVHVTVGDVLVADSARPRTLLESGLPPRWYLPRDDVRGELLEPSGTTTRCPYEGSAHHWSSRTGSGYAEDLVRTCPEPLHDAEAVRGLLRLPQETVDVEVTA